MAIRFLIAISLLLPLATFAAGIQVSPARLEIDSGISESTSLTVTNPTNDVQIYEVLVDDFDEVIKVSPESFTLEAGENRNVSVTINQQALQNSSEIISTTISVVQKPLADARFQAKTGVKIPITVVTNEAESESSNPWNRVNTVALGIIGLAALMYALSRKLK